MTVILTHESLCTLHVLNIFYVKRGTVDTVIYLLVFCSASSNSASVARMNDWLRILNLKGCERNRYWPNLRYFPDSCKN
jgi:hypothetical protein